MTLHQETRQGVANSIYLILGVIIISPLLALHFGSRDIVKQWHPFYHIGDIESKGYHLWWYLTLVYIMLKSVLWAGIALLKKQQHLKLIIVFFVYEIIMFADFILIYGRSPVRWNIEIILSLYMFWYHYKYE